MRPDIAIDTWRHWDASLHARPRVLEALSGGRSNHSFLLDSEGTKMVLRLNGSESVLPGASRDSEHRIWQAASTQGIAPPLLYADDASEFLVSAFIENELPSRPGLDKVYVKHAYDLLERCHQLDIDAPRIDYSSHIKNFWRIIENSHHPTDPGLYEQRERMQSLLEELNHDGCQTGLCHHDLVTANFVGNHNRLYLIDWEYAANGLLVMDYAALGVEWGLEDSDIFEHTGIQPELIARAKTLYGYLCKLWEAATA